MMNVITKLKRKNSIDKHKHRAIQATKKIWSQDKPIYYEVFHSPQLSFKIDTTTTFDSKRFLDVFMILSLIGQVTIPVSKIFRFHKVRSDQNK